MEIMRTAGILTLAVLGSVALISGAIYVINRQKRLPPIKDARPLKTRNPALGKSFHKRRGA